MVLSTSTLPKTRGKREQEPMFHMEPWKMEAFGSWHLLSGWFVQEISPKTFKTVKHCESQDFLWTQAALTQHNAAQRAREQLTILAGPGPKSQEKEWLGTNGKTGDRWIFKGPGVFVVFSLIVANFCKNRPQNGLTWPYKMGQYK